MVLRRSNMIPLLALSLVVGMAASDNPPPPPRDPNEKKRNRSGYTWEEWCREADIDMTQFGTHNLPGRWAQMWLQNVHPKNIRTMKDRNGHNVLVGDTVKFFPTGLDEEWYEGTIQDIRMNVRNEWENREEPVAHIQRKEDPTTEWKRYGSNIERKDVW